jgi:broad specificity phosphatase PhoE
MSGTSLSSELQVALFRAADRLSYVTSVTVTGSFAETGALEGLSDIDVVVVVDRLDRPRYDEIVRTCETAVRPVVERCGYELKVNSTLGPLKYNEPGVAVLHLMLYSHDAHVEHVINSPFTCFDWQRSTVKWKRSLADVYPVFGLQPRHFVDARRSPRDYLADLEAGEITYRDLECDAHGYREVRRTLPMKVRDKHEFAYHVMRFLMRNVLKLIYRTNDVPTTATDLLDAYFAVFPEEREGMAELFQHLNANKRHQDYTRRVLDLERQVARFVNAFTAQFREAFIDNATHHVVMRHAATAANVGDVAFLGRSDPPILEGRLPQWDWQSLTAVAKPSVAWCSPLQRCRQTVDRLVNTAEMQVIVDDRLIEYDYGACERLSVAQARQAFPELFQAWSQGEDPPFPGGGENTADVARRAKAFVEERLRDARHGSLVCTHNGVIRAMVGDLLGIPAKLWHRLSIPHCEPITIVSSRRFGVFVNIPPTVERRMFHSFATDRN